MLTHGSLFSRQKAAVLVHGPAHCAHGGLPSMDTEGPLNITKGTWLQTITKTNDDEPLHVPLCCEIPHLLLSHKASRGGNVIAL